MIECHANFVRLFQTLEKPEPKKDKKPFILRKKKKLETSGKTTTTEWVSGLHVMIFSDDLFEWGMSLWGPIY